jgi:enoyl-[acyl-carrier protein] reductase III
MVTKSLPSAIAKRSLLTKRDLALQRQKVYTWPRKEQISLRFGRPAERDEMDFEGKVALVTGSGRGIGRAIALHLAQHGADIVVNFFRNRAPAEETAHEVEALGRKAIAVSDIGRPEGIEQLFAETGARSGVGHPGVQCRIGYNRPVMEQRVKGWDWTMNINARSALFCAQRLCR